MSRPRTTRRGALSAAIVTAVVLVALIVGQLLLGTVTLVQGASFGVAPGPLFQGAVMSVLSTAGLSTVPLAIGVFLSLWQVAPIGSDLRVGHVLARSTLAAGIGAMLALIVSSIGGVVQLIMRDPASVFGRPESVLAQQVPFALGFAVVTALEAFVAALPLVALGALLLWIRLRGNDRDYRVEGMLDL